MRKILPKFFNFEGIGILFRDIKDNNLFSIDNSIDEDDVHIMKVLEDKEKNNEELTEEEKIMLAERQHKKRTQPKFPNNLGVTGEAFNTGKIVTVNKVALKNNFLPSIDNLSHNVKEVHSLMVVPIFGHHTYNAEEEATQNEKMPIGVLQFINKVNFGQIEQYDIVST